MGNANNKCTLTEDELNHCVKSTVFTVDEVKALWFHFKKISGGTHDFITRTQFQTAMLFKDSALLDRIFRVFDADDDNQISFLEYLSCLSTISSKAPKEDKLKFSFQIYDFDGDNFISTTDLTAVVAASLREQKILIRRADIDEIVAQTMATAQPKHPSMLSYDEYRALVGDKAHMLALLTINISGIIAEYTRSNVVPLSTPRGFQSALDLHDRKMTK
eukprot:gene36128-43812_t